MNTNLTGPLGRRTLVLVAATVPDQDPLLLHRHAKVAFARLFLCKFFADCCLLLKDAAYLALLVRREVLGKMAKTVCQEHQAFLECQACLPLGPALKARLLLAQ